MDKSETFPRVKWLDQHAALVEFEDGGSCRVRGEAAREKNREAVLKAALKARWEALGPETEDAPKVTHLHEQLVVVTFADGEACRVWDEEAIAKGREAILEIAYALRREALGPDDYEASRT